MIAALFIAFVAFTGCKKEEETPDPVTPTPTPSLYERLGGINAIAAVTDKFLANVASDNTINARFADAVANPYRLQLLRNNLIDQICAGSGGPCQYKGKSMLEAHTGMNITQEEFNALVGDLVAALDFYEVPAAEKNELLGILGPMQTDIVGQ
ncbi:MAG: globin [Crocinitomicaceae bacterium]|nr:globin [Crocinitomicaceae bacterium]